MLFVARRGQRVEFMKLRLQQLLVGQLGLVRGDQRWRERTTKGIFDNLAVLGGAEQNADGWALVRLSNIAVKGLQVEIKLAEVFRFKLADLELEGDEALQAAVEEQQIEGEVSIADLERHFATDEAEVAP